MSGLVQEFDGLRSVARLHGQPAHGVSIYLLGDVLFSQPHRPGTAAYRARHPVKGVQGQAETGQQRVGDAIVGKASYRKPFMQSRVLAQRVEGPCVEARLLMIMCVAGSPGP